MEMMMSDLSEMTVTLRVEGIEEIREVIDALREEIEEAHDTLSRAGVTIRGDAEEGRLALPERVAELCDQLIHCSEHWKEHWQKHWQERCRRNRAESLRLEEERDELRDELDAAKDQLNRAADTNSELCDRLQESGEEEGDDRTIREHLEDEQYEIRGVLEPILREQGVEDLDELSTADMASWVVDTLKAARYREQESKRQLEDLSICCPQCRMHHREADELRDYLQGIAATFDMDDDAEPMDVAAKADAVKGENKQFRELSDELRDYLSEIGDVVGVKGPMSKIVEAVRDAHNCEQDAVAKGRYWSALEDARRERDEAREERDSLRGQRDRERRMKRQLSDQMHAAEEALKAAGIEVRGRNITVAEAIGGLAEKRDGLREMIVEDTN